MPLANQEEACPVDAAAFLKLQDHLRFLVAELQKRCDNDDLKQQIQHADIQWLDWLSNANEWLPQLHVPTNDYVKRETEVNISEHTHQ